MFTLSITMDGKFFGQSARSVAAKKARMKSLLKRIELRCRSVSARAAAAVDPSVLDEASARSEGTNDSLARTGSQCMNENGDLAVYRKETYAQVK